MAFELFSPYMATRSSGRAFVALTKAGVLTFGSVAADRFGFKDGSKVLVYFDATKRRIGFKAANGAQAKDAYTFRITNKESRSLRLSFVAFCRNYKIELTERGRFEPYQDLDSGMVVVDLKTPVGAAK